MEYNIHAITSKGPSHRDNEDNYFIGDNFVIIADGMGGEAAGEVASDIAVQTITENLAICSINNFNEDEIRKMSYAAILDADAKIQNYVSDNPNSYGMGTTVLLAILIDTCLYITWCGDSRCYLYHSGKLKALTKDHSYVQELVDSGNITEQDSVNHPDNNLITKFVGGGKEFCNPDFCHLNLTESDALILCSDGLSGYCGLNDIEDTVSKHLSSSYLPSKLVDLAIKKGSYDDITIVVVKNKLLCKRSFLSVFSEWIKSSLQRKTSSRSMQR